MLRTIRSIFDSPFLHRLSWHVKRVTEKMDRRFFRSLLLGLVVVLGLAAGVVWLAETDRTLADFGASFYWAVTTVLGQGDAAFVSGPVGWAVSWLLSLFGVAIVATITGALVGFVIDFLLKEGQGMGAAGYSDHIVICGWNSTARDLVDELAGDDYDIPIVLIHDSERSPARDGVYFVRGNPSDERDLRRAGIESAKSAIVCPIDGSDVSDLQSILTVLAIETIAPDVRTVAEVNNQANVEHFRRARVNEILVTSKLASHLLARSAIYPGLSELVIDLVSGGEGSELYRVHLPEDMGGLTVNDVSARLRAEHKATVLAVCRNGSIFSNPEAEFVVSDGDDLVVVAESLGELVPLRMEPGLDEAPTAEIRHTATTA
jgi:voltage-gated potassium channel